MGSIPVEGSFNFFTGQICFAPSIVMWAVNVGEVGMEMDRLYGRELFLYKLVAIVIFSG